MKVKIIETKDYRNKNCKSEISEFELDEKTSQDAINLLNKICDKFNLSVLHEIVKKLNLKVIHKIIDKISVENIKLVLEMLNKKGE